MKPSSFYEHLLMAVSFPNLFCCSSPKRSYEDALKTPPVLPSSYESAAPRHVRFFLHEVAEWFVKKGLVEAPKSGDVLTMG
jgi:hypothetical protein